ncbi:MAG: hypothetical protein ABI858_01625 [Pseudoxanthomonas sp.]
MFDQRLLSHPHPAFFIPAHCLFDQAMCGKRRAIDALAFNVLVLTTAASGCRLQVAGLLSDP